MGREQEIGAGNRRKVQVRAQGRRKRFGVDRQETFLRHFAATCNAKASAEAAEVGISTVYMRRMRDAAFRAAYDAALAQGYATLEAEMVRRATLTVAIEPDPEALASISTMDARTALSLLQLHRKGMELGMGNVQPRKSDVEQARARLEKRMRGLGLLAGGGEKGPSTASRSPSPRNRGEDR